MGLRSVPRLHYTARSAAITATRRIRIEGIYQRWVPIPGSRGDQAVVDFMNEIEQVVGTALKDFEVQVKAEAQSGVTAVLKRAA